MSALAALPLISVAHAAHLAGCLGLVCSCTWPFMQRRPVILAIQMLGSILFGLHYLLLGATTASAMCCMGAVQGLALVLLRRRSLQLGAVGATVVIGAILTSLTWSGFPSFLSQVGQLGSAAGRLQRGTQRLRQFFLGSECLWTIVNLIVGTPFGLAANTLSLTSLLLGLWRNSQPAAGRMLNAAT